MSDSTITLEKLVARLERVARKNEDEFRYYIRLDVWNGNVSPSFVCEETALKHTFLSRKGATIEEVVNLAWGDIAPACEAWGYKSVE